MKQILTARRDDGQAGALAALLIDATAGDEIVVENWDLKNDATRVLDQHGIAGVTITVDPEAVAAARGIPLPLRRMTGAQRRSPFHVPERAPTPVPPMPEHVRHPSHVDEAELPSD